MTYRKLSVASYSARSHVDGPGERTVVFVCGCSIQCPGCQNNALWEEGWGTYTRPEDVACKLLEPGLPITISGGEPFDQPEALELVLKKIRAVALHREVIIYTGRHLECLLDTGNQAILHALAMTDILVDGPYMNDQDHEGMQYRGSANQRVIDLRATFKSGHESKLVLLDWSQPELILTAEGNIIAPTPLAREFAALGQLTATRRCGEVGSS